MPYTTVPPSVDWFLVLALFDCHDVDQRHGAEAPSDGHYLDRISTCSVARVLVDLDKRC